MSIIEKALEKLEGKTPTSTQQASPAPPSVHDPLAAPELSEKELLETERAVNRVQSAPEPRTTPASRVVPTLQPDAAAGATPARETRASSPAAQDRPAMLAPEPPAAAARAAVEPTPTASVATSRRVEIDLGRLEQAGFLTPNHAQSTLAEEYRHLKRPLLRRAAVNAPQRVAGANMAIVTSSLPGEGKTYMAVNLAMSIAMEVDCTVLLVDADVAKADVSRVLGMHQDAGLSSYLSGKETDLSKLIVRTNVEKLAVLPSGPHFSKLTELLASAQMTALVEELSMRYPDRIVLFDSPPLLATSGASVLAHLMGQVLLVVEAVRTPKSAVKASLRQLAGAHNVNFVLNKQRRGIGSGYGGGYGYGYGYGYGGQPYAYGNRPAEG